MSAAGQVGNTANGTWNRAVYTGQTNVVEDHEFPGCTITQEGLLTMEFFSDDSMEASHVGTATVTGRECPFSSTCDFTRVLPGPRSEDGWSGCNFPK